MKVDAVFDDVQKLMCLVLQSYYDDCGCIRGVARL